MEDLIKYLAGSIKVQLVELEKEVNFQKMLQYDDYPLKEEVYILQQEIEKLRLRLDELS